MAGLCAILQPFIFPQVSRGWLIWSGAIKSPLGTTLGHQWLVTCHWSFVQPQPESCGHLRLLARVEQSAGARNPYRVQCDCGGQVQREVCGGLAGEAQGRALCVVVGHPNRDQVAGMGAVAEKRFVEEFAPHPAIEAFETPQANAMLSREPATRSASAFPAR